MIKAFLIISTLISSFAPSPSNATGEFNLFTEKITCTHDLACWHEVGHLLDSDYALSTLLFWQWQSSQLEFRDSVNNFLRQCKISSPRIFLIDEYCSLFINFPGINNNPFLDVYQFTNLEYLFSKGWGGYKELYAELLACAGGKTERLPNSFEKFYDQKIIDEISNEYDLEYLNNTEGILCLY